MKPTHISVNEAARMLGVTVGWIRKMLATGELEGFKLNGRAWAIPREAVEKRIGKRSNDDGVR